MLSIQNLARSLDRAPPWALLAAALSLALCARLLLAGWTAVAAYALAVALFLLAAQAGSSRLATGRPQVAGLLAGYASLVAGAVSLLVKTAQPTSAFQAWGWVLLVWLTALGAYALAWASPRCHVQTIVRVWRGHRVELLVALAIILGGLFLRTIALDRFPRTFGGDDGQAGLLARAALKGEIVAPFATVAYALAHLPSLYTLAQGLVMRLFGDDVSGVRMLSALLGTGALVGVYVLGRRWFGPVVALVATAFLATFPFHLFWSRSPLTVVADTLAVVAILLFATTAFGSGRPLHYSLAGLSLGLGQYGYQSIRLMFGVVGLLALRELIIDRSWLRRNWANLLAMVGGAAVAYLPQATYFVDHQEHFWGRFGQVSIVGSGWLAVQMQQTGLSAFELLGEQFRLTFLVFNAVAPHMFFEPRRPLLDPFSGALFLFGVVLALAKIRERGYFALVVTLLTYLLLSAMTTDPPSSSRLATTAPLAALLVAVGLVRISEITRASLGLPQAGSVVLAGIATAGIAAMGIHFYFVQYGNSYDRGLAEAGTELAYHMRRFPPGTRFLLLGQPWMSCTTHRSVQFIAPDWTCLDVPPPERPEPRPALQPGDVVAALGARRNEAQRLASSLSGVKERTFLSDGTGSLLFVAFEPEAAHGPP